MGAELKKLMCYTDEKRRKHKKEKKKMERTKTFVAVEKNVLRLKGWNSKNVKKFFVSRITEKGEKEWEKEQGAQKELHY